MQNIQVYATTKIEIKTNSSDADSEMYVCT
jgi:hypothetical protein